VNSGDVAKQLLADGWREYPNGFKKHARCFYKRFDTPTACFGNRPKPGVCIEIAVSEREGQASMEMELCAGLSDKTWVKILNYSMPKTVHGVVAAIPRILKAWEAMNASG
jgi:hypothetical protein